jgi:hypothetical protein
MLHCTRLTLCSVLFSYIIGDLRENTYPDSRGHNFMVTCGHILFPLKENVLKHKHQYNNKKCHVA